MKRYRIRAGVQCFVSHRGGEWMPYTTTKETDLDEPITESRSFWVFAVGRWRIQIHPRKVSYRVRDGWRPVKA